MRAYLGLIISLSFAWQGYARLVHGGVAGDRPVDFEEVFESCKAVGEATNFDPTWESKLGLKWDTTTYHAPVASAGDIYRVTQQFLGHNDFNLIRLSQMKDSCFRIKLNDDTGLSRTFLGYGNKHFVKHLTPLPNKQMTLSYPAPFKGNWGAEITIAATDNKSYTLVVLCHADGLGSWAALSPFKTLDREAIEEIKGHVRAWGFNEDNMIHLNYDPDNCNTRPADIPN